MEQKKIMSSKNSVDKFITVLTDAYTDVKIPADSIVELDLGCGKGGFTTALAKKYPDRLIFAADVMLGRLRKLAKRNLRNGVNNIRLLRSEAWFLMGVALPDGSINRLHLLCPDPWPKEKHKGHRLISSEFVARVYEKLKNNGVFHFSTDDNNYFRSAVQIIGASGLFGRDDRRIADVLDIRTDFEQKWNEEGLKVNHSGWIRIG